MSAIDETSEVIFHRYENKEWQLEKHSFPASMNSFKEIRDYFGYTVTVTDENYMSQIAIYRKENWIKERVSFEYAVIINFFEDHAALVMCPTYIDLLHLMNEIKGLSIINLGYFMDSIQTNIIRINKKLDSIKDTVESNDISLQIKWIGNLIEVGIGKKIKEYIDEAVEKITDQNKELDLDNDEDLQDLKHMTFDGLDTVF
jgi:hypothetical protein